jgi:hypothetical protein
VILAFAITGRRRRAARLLQEPPDPGRREIDAIERRIEHCRLEIRTTEMRMDQLLNRFVIRKQLEENGSNLRPISLAVVEEIDPAPPHRGVSRPPLPSP